MARLSDIGPSLAQRVADLEAPLAVLESELGVSVEPSPEGVGHPDWRNSRLGPLQAALADLNHIAGKSCRPGARYPRDHPGDRWALPVRMMWVTLAR